MFYSLLHIDHLRFLPAKLQIQSILEHDTLRDRRLALQNTPADLFDAYATTLKRIKQQAGTRPQRGLYVLVWIYLGKRPLKVVELQHALATKPGDTTFDTEGMTSEKSLVECCLGLVVVEAETSTIRLTHFTLEEYFDKHWKDPDLFPSGHSTIAATCLSYLQFDHEAPPLSQWGRDEYFKRLKEPAPLLQYAVENVGLHLRMNSGRALAEQCIAILEQEKKFQLLALGMTDSDNTSLHWAAYFGCTSVAELLLGHLDLNTELQRQGAPALHATEQDDEAEATTIFKRSAANINSKSSYNHTPLSIAVGRGHKEVVWLLLNAPGVDVNTSDNSGTTPLSLAVERDQKEVVQLLLNAPGVDVNTSDTYGTTPLSLAVERGQKEVVQLLLNAPGVDVNTSNMYGSTPLSRAAAEGHEEVVRSLLGVPGVGVNTSDKDGDTPLSLAAGKGQKEGGLDADHNWVFPSPPKPPPS
jgi:ankyrin repeat protein